MPSKQRSQSTEPGVSLGDAATRFLTTVSIGSQSEAQQEVIKFVRWFGEGRMTGTLTGQEVVNYSEQIYTSTNKSTEHLNTIKKFLQFVHKENYTSANLGIHIKIKKVPGKTASGIAVRTDEPVFLTRQGYEEAKARLAHLQSERPRIAEEIHRAAADKDFRENAPLQAAREHMSHLEGQIKEHEDTLRRAKVVEDQPDKGLRVGIGDIVVLEHESSGERITYTLVSSREANVRLGKISVASPMGQAIINKEIGEVVGVNAPSGIINYCIKEIKKDQADT
jgi:transcription elongation factor GreA